MYNFSQALVDMERKRRLSGRPATREDYAGIAEGYARSSSDRLNAAKTLSLQEDQFNQNMAFQQNQDAYQRVLAEKMMKQDKKSDQQALMLGIAAPIVTPIISNAISSGVQWLSDGTWLCTATRERAGLTKEEWAAIRDFRGWARENHPVWLDFYINIGPQLVDMVADWQAVKNDMVLPVVSLTEAGYLPAAYAVYKMYVMDLIKRIEGGDGLIQDIDRKEIENG